MKETNTFEEATNLEKLLTHILPTTLFCEQCGITETSPSFGQYYCRYCGAKFKNKPWVYMDGKELVGPQEERFETNKEELPIWVGKNCKDCGNEKCKKLGTVPKGYDCALWQPESEEKDA